MLENSLWFQYHPQKTIRETLASIYGCDALQIGGDEGALYAELKRTLTKKELRLFIMAEADIARDEVMAALGLTEEELAKSLKKTYHKLRNKVHPKVKAVKSAGASDDTEA